MQYFDDLFLKHIVIYLANNGVTVEDITELTKGTPLDPSCVSDVNFSEWKEKLQRLYKKYSFEQELYPETKVYYVKHSIYLKGNLKTIGNTFLFGVHPAIWASQYNKTHADQEKNVIVDFYEKMSIHDFFEDIYSA